MSDVDLRSSIGFKGKKTSFDGFKRNLNAIRTDTSKRQALPTYVLPKYVKFGYKGNRLKQVTVELKKTVGETFSGMVADLRVANPLYTAKKANKRVAFLLKLPKSKYKRLPKGERDILRDYGY